jgi:hypothetical protein
MLRRLAPGAAYAALAFPLSLGLLAALSDPAPAQERPGRGPGAAAESKPIPDADEVTAGLERLDGFWKLYFKKSQSGRREPPVKILAEIPMQEIGQPFLLATSFTGGTTYAGWQWTEALLSWERLGEDRLVLIERDVRFRAEGGGPLAEVVKRTYSDRVVKAVQILGQGRNGENRGYLVDGKDLFADNAGLFFDGIGGQLDASVARFDGLKCFPNNTEVEVTMPTRRGGQLTTLHYSLSRLPRTDYKPRAADDRVGYFLTAAKDWTRGRPEDDCFVRFVNRWDLQKADPSLRISPPKKQIVFYVEKTVPIRLRRFVREGILEWNKAFEKIGFSEAIAVRQQTDDNEFKDYDPEDVRYNFFRWITSETPFAMGPSRVNPMTGEILDADIIFDDSMVRSYLRNYEEMIKRAPETFFTPRERAFFAGAPELHPFAGTRLAPAATGARASEGESPVAGPGAHAMLDATLFPEQPSPALLRSACSYGEGVAHELCMGALADMALQPGSGKGGNPAEYPEEFIGQVVKEVVMHEVGHTLGLRHNFKASTWLGLADIEKSEGTANVGSVMDYNPLSIALPGEKQGDFVTTTLGPYDYWAIEYGYKPVQNDEELKKVAARVAEKGLAYATDEDVASPDPLVNRWDLGADPLAFSQKRIALAERLMQDVVKRVVPDGEGYQRARRALDMLLYEYMRSASFAAKFVGGQYIHRDHKGDPSERAPLVVVEPAKQRAAVKLICEKVLADGAITLPKEALPYMAAGRWSHWGTDDWGEDVNYPLHERILSIQRMALAMLLSPSRLENVHDAELALGADKDALTLPELLSSLTGAVFTEVAQKSRGDKGVSLDPAEPAETPEASVRKPLIATPRQNLQRAYLGQLIGIALRSRYGSAPQVVKALAFEELKSIRTSAASALKTGGGKLDPYTRAHLEETVKRIDKALEAEFQAQ